MAEEITRGVHPEKGNRCSEAPPPPDCTLPSEVMGEPPNGEVVSKKPRKAARLGGQGKEK